MAFVSVFDKPEEQLANTQLATGLETNGVSTEKVADDTKISAVNSNDKKLENTNERVYRRANTGDIAAKIELIVGLRDSCNLVYIDTTTWAQRQISMNENIWDTHVSFCPLSLSPSPNGRWLLVAGDNNMHVVYHLGTNTRLRVLNGGHMCSGFGRPSVSWECTNDYIYCNSEGENTIYVYSLCSGRVVSILKGHFGAVRCVTCHETKRLVLSGSYDKSIILWARN